MWRRWLLALALSVTLGLGSLVQVQGSPQETYARAGSFNKNKYPQARRAIENNAGFPNLRGDFEVVDPTTGMRFNCISHSLGIHARWVNPQTGPAANPLGPMDRMYREQGYRRLAGLDLRPNPRQQKVVVYATKAGGRIKEVTHAALQERDGTWTSKLGQLPLIRHRNPQALNGPSYGEPVAVYVRTRR